MSTSTNLPADQLADVEALVNRIVYDFTAAASISMVELGDRLGLYRAMLNRGSMTPSELADATGYNCRLISEWLKSQAANELVSFEPATTGYELTPAASAVLADPESTSYLVGAANVISSYYADLDQAVAAFRGDGAVPWGSHHSCMYSGVEKFFSTAYENSLVAEWVPALDGVAERLEAGIRVADVGCGHGISTSLLAKSFPNSSFVGFDSHQPSIDRATVVAKRHGVDIEYRTCSADEIDGGPFDLICFFDCLHDMGDPGGAIRKAREQLAPGGTVLLVEMHAEDDLEANFRDPFSGWWYAASVMLCTPCALAQGGEALGNQVGTAAWRDRFQANGFTYFTEALRTPFNLILEARL